MRRRLPAVVLLGLAACSHQPAKTDAAPARDATARAEAPRPQGGPLAALHGLVLPPPEPGGFRSSVSGCAAGPTRKTEETRAAPAEEKVEVSGLATGLVVTHDAEHACCLTEKTSVVVEAQKVTITEAFEGAPCRCRCGSTLRTAVGLPRGSYAVEVKTVAPAQARTAWTGEIVVK